MGSTPPMAISMALTFRVSVQPSVYKDERTLREQSLKIF